MSAIWSKAQIRQRPIAFVHQRVEKNMKSIKFGLVLCAAMLAAGCVTKQTYNTEVQKADTYAALDKQLSSQLSSDQAQITQMQNQLKVTMVNEVLFPAGGWTLSPKGEQA